MLPIKILREISVIVDVLDDIISKNHKPELIGYQLQLLDSKSLLQISFLKEALSITNTLSLVLQADKKDFGVIRKAINSTITILTEMARDQNTIHLKSFNGKNEI